MKECDNCGMPVSSEFGTVACSDCGDERCVEFCIPGGVGTECVDCEGMDDDEDDE